MARMPRLDLPGFTQHIIQRGNNRSNCFVTDRDYAAYINWLEQASRKYHVAIHAWVLMTNHVHLLATPTGRYGVSKMMQSLGRLYVRYFNQCYGRTGTLWEGRFKSCLIDSEAYLLQCYRYIELNPVRAGMVREPGDYHWSSFCANALGKEIKLCTAHNQYLALGVSKVDRLTNYKSLFNTPLSTKQVDTISKVTNNGMALGSESFVNKVENLSQRRAREGKRGRPKGK